MDYVEIMGNQAIGTALQSWGVKSEKLSLCLGPLRCFFKVSSRIPSTQLGFLVRLGVFLGNLNLYSSERAVFLQHLSQLFTLAELARTYVYII